MKMNDFKVFDYALPPTEVVGLPTTALLQNHLPAHSTYKVGRMCYMCKSKT